MDSLWHDLRTGLRLLTRNPALTATCVLTLGLGIGTATLMFSIPNGSFWEPLPFEESDRLVYPLSVNLASGSTGNSLFLHDFLDFRERQTTCEAIGAWYSITVNVSSAGDPPQPYRGACISPAAFRIVRSQPFLGRFFSPEEMQPGGPPVIILSHRVWQERFAGDPGIVNRTIRANGQNATIIGVMPEGFFFPDNQDCWLPHRQDPLLIERGEGVPVQTIARLKPGVHREQAQAEFSAIAADLAIAHPETNRNRGVRLNRHSWIFLAQREAVLIYLMLAATVIVLLIACLNVTNILLSRTAGRIREMAVRSSLGANRSRLIRQLLIEAFTLALPGMFLGLLFCQIGLEFFSVGVARTQPPWWFRFDVDPNVLLYAGALMFFTTLSAGLIPALQASRISMNDFLKEASRSATGSRVTRSSRFMVMTEIAFSAGLLFAAGLTVKSILHLNDFDFGIRKENVVSARVRLSEADYPTRESRTALWVSIATRLQELPGIRGSAVTPFLPLEGAVWAPLVPRGQADREADSSPVSAVKMISPGYFNTVGIELLQGRDFTPADEAGAPRVAIVNTRYAERHLGGLDPVGQRLERAGTDTGEPGYIVIGVVGNEWINSDNSPAEVVYTSLFQDDRNFANLVVRTRGERETIVEAMREAVVELDPHLPVYQIRTMDEVIYDQTWAYSLFGNLLVIIGILALILASVGLYGVIAFTVSQRTREFGIRSALGARPGNIIALVMKQGARQLGSGMLIGVGLAWVFAQGMRNMFFGVVPSDPLVLFTILLVLGTSGIVACLFPARRAVRIDPLSAMRQE